MPIPSLLLYHENGDTRDIWDPNITADLSSEEYIIVIGEKEYKQHFYRWEGIHHALS